ncbi:phosphohydrolase [Segetibacter aerophilus]|uniref:Phosphohydrolase n=2 Tax=Segetibacter aerophilus TaxID=670293 RepID=A0A512BF93_9BACT|nr:phosphohydrolase [Segetibacter aerophilus]
MPVSTRKIINDPVYGFISITDPLIYKITTHTCYQRLRRIYQMALAHLVYPGAVHTRFHHSLGAYHLMCNALGELSSKGIEITREEEVAAKAAILLHDIGHGPFSHALENILLKGIHHETLSLHIMRLLNEEFGGELQMAIDIFTDKYPKRFLHQLVSGQLDVDRMDYLTRDSFFTGVSEGVIGYDRIIKMMAVKNGELLVEEKGIYSIEKFLVARRLMYWQVYLHKTVLVAEKMLIKIVERVRALGARESSTLLTGTSLDFFLFEFDGKMDEEAIRNFVILDDMDFMHGIKTWSKHPDQVLSVLCQGILDRKLLKIKLQAEPFIKDLVQQKLKQACQRLSLTNEEAGYFVFTGEAVNTMYKTSDERINILFKDGIIKDISQVDNALIHNTLSSTVKKFYICYYE